MNPLESKRELKTLLLISLLAAIILGVYYSVGLKPLLQEASRLGQQVHTVHLKLQHVEQAIVREPQLRQEFSQLSEMIQSLSTSLPSEEELPSVIALLTDLASQTGVKIQTIFPQRSFESRTPGSDQPTKPPELYKEVPIQIDALAGFHQLGSFLSLVESGTQPIQLRSLRISGNPKEPRRHNTKLVLIAYFAAPGATSASGPIPSTTQGGS